MRKSKSPGSGGSQWPLFLREGEQLPVDRKCSIRTNHGGSSHARGPIMVVKPVSTSLRFPFASLANKRREVVISTCFDSHGSTVIILSALLLKGGRRIRNRRESEEHMSKNGSSRGVCFLY